MFKNYSYLCTDKRKKTEKVIGDLVMITKNLMVLFYVDETDNTKNTILVTDRDLFGEEELQKEVARQVKAYLSIELDETDLYFLSSGDDVSVGDYSLGWEQTPCILPYKDEGNTSYLVNLSYGNDAEIEVQECDTMEDAVTLCKEHGLPIDAIKKKKK